MVVVLRGMGWPATAPANAHLGLAWRKYARKDLFRCVAQATAASFAHGRFLWPGGKLLVNADASEGELSVRVTDGKRKVIPGFDYDDCLLSKQDSVTQEITWKKASTDSLAGKVVRFEFFLKDADLFTFRASVN